MTSWTERTLCPVGRCLCARFSHTGSFSERCAASYSRSSMRELQGRRMSARAFGIELYGYTDAPTLLEEIQHAERLGYASVWLGDSQLIWRDLYVMLGAAAATTAHVALATGVTNPVTRHPAVTASAIMTLQELT